MKAKYELFIGGEFSIGAKQEYFPAINPFTRSEWALIPQADAAQVASAIGAARHAFDTRWRKTPGVKRAELLVRLAELLTEDAARMASIETTDNGKVIRETSAQMGFAARMYRFYAAYADKMWGKQIPVDDRDVLDFTVREPAGVAVLITPWNSPMTLLAAKLAPALASGNCVVVKPSEHASATTLEFARLVAAAGFPHGVINVVTGDDRVGKALLTGGRIDRVSFTGSPAVGREISAAAGRQLVPVTLELGGKSPNIIFDDANLNKAIVGALAGIFAATGQTCIAGSRLLVQRGVYEEVLQRLADRAKRIRLGDPLNPTTEMGTVANEPQFHRILAAIKSAESDGAKLITGGRPGSGPQLGNGLFVEPTIFGEVDNSMSLAQNEIFGPVLAVIPFDTEEEAIEIANDTQYGLASGVWTQDVSRALRMGRELNSGTVWINTYRVAAAQAPFGGVKDSGHGRERGEIALDEFTTTKNVMINFSETERDPFAVKL